MAADDLVAWLTQIWDEQEKLAKDAPPSPWSSSLETGDDAEDFGSVYSSPDGSWSTAKTVGDWYMPGAGDFIAANDPASLLARIAADRQILALHSLVAETPDDGGEPYLVCATCWGEWPCTTARLLAQPYADRPGWQEAWRVTP